jgi:hypothetical protein
MARKGRREPVPAMTWQQYHAMGPGTWRREGLEHRPGKAGVEEHRFWGTSQRDLDRNEMRSWRRGRGGEGGRELL